MFTPRCRGAVANIDSILNDFGPFIVIIGGSSEDTIKNCELYYPEQDQFYPFPSLNLARENASACIFNDKDNGCYIYCFGGFDKRAIDDIERIKIEFSDDMNETKSNLRPIVSSKWELIKNASLVKSVECCGTY